MVLGHGNFSGHSSLFWSLGIYKSTHHFLFRKLLEKMRKIDLQLGQFKNLVISIIFEKKKYFYIPKLQSKPYLAYLVTQNLIILQKLGLSRLPFYPVFLFFLPSKIFLLSFIQNFWYFCNRPHKQTNKQTYFFIKFSDFLSLFVCLFWWREWCSVGNKTCQKFIQLPSMSQTEMERNKPGKRFFK